MNHLHNGTPRLPDPETLKARQRAAAVFPKMRYPQGLGCEVLARELERFARENAHRLWDPVVVPPAPRRVEDAGWRFWFVVACLVLTGTAVRVILWLC